MYRREHSTFREQLGGHGGSIAEAMWDRLDDILYQS
jgi:hypothetical protein